MKDLIQAPLEEQTDRRFLIHGVDWATYEKFLAAVDDRHIFLTYDGESLEFMIPSSLHELFKFGLAALVRISAREVGLALKGYASTTLRRRDRKRGLEADECFYVHNVPAILGKRELDFTKDPPPDLAIEIDITRSSLDREGVYAALVIPELWRCDGESLRFFLLNSQRAYEESARSAIFPFIDPVQIVALLRQTWDLDDLALENLLRAWVRKHMPAKTKKKSANDRKKRPN